MGGRPTIRLVVPATPAHRALALQVVAEGARLVAGRATAPRRRRYEAAWLTAFGEIFNNVALHAYRRHAGPLELRLTVDHETLALALLDHGEPFDPAAVPSPDLDALPQGGLGLYLARAVLDELVYRPGPPNRWRLVKRLRDDDEPDSDAPR